VTLIVPKPPDVVPDLQRRAIEALASRYPFEREVVVSRPANIERYAQLMIAKLKELDKSQRPFFRALINQATPLEEISSEGWNEAQDRIYVDLYALHRALGESLAEDAYRGELTRDQFVKTHASILQIINEIRLYQFLRGNPEYQDAKFVNFSTSLNETPRKPAAIVDTAVRLLELPPRAREVQSKRQSAFKGAKVSVTHLGGGRLGGRNTDFTPDRMLDANPDSYWAEMIMAESPIGQEYVGSGDGGLGGAFDSDGAICHVLVEMAKVITANTIRILPFGEFPVRVIDVAFKENAGQTEWVMVPGFRVEDATLDWIEVNFEPRTIAALRVTLEQINYRSNLYHLPQRLVSNGLLWESILQTRRTQTLQELNLSVRDQELLKADPQQIARLMALDDFKGLMEKAPLQQGREQVFNVGVETTMAGARVVTKPEPTDVNAISTVLKGTEEETPQKTVTIRTYEYVYGVRELQILFNLYQPVAHYSSPKFSTSASILEVGLTTEERHIPSNDGMGDYHRTSVEWDIEVGRDRRYPVAPKNWLVGSDLIVPDEYLQFDRTTRQAVTRLSMAALQGTLRCNGTRVPLSQFTIETYTPPSSGVPGRYLATGLANPAFFGPVDPASNISERGLVTVDAEVFDPNAVYTLQYTAAPGADTVDVDEDLNSVEMAEPEVFQTTSRDNQLILKAFPYVDYRIINSSLWQKQTGEARWAFSPGAQNYVTGTVTVTNGSKVITGSGTAWLSLTAGQRLFRRDGDEVVYKIATVDTNGSAELEAEYEGVSGSALSYVIGEYFETDGRIFGLDRSLYEPVKVLVNDVKAVNLTDYEAFEHQAFTDVPRTGRQIQFIHAGRLLYFNRPISNSKIEVFYSWLTQYVQVNATLRSNIPVRTVLTPQVNSARVELKTSRL
jgi:hypothetical protein